MILENPGSSNKARGHLGTEIKNKVSTVIQVGFEKDSDNHLTDLIKISFRKCKSSRKHDPFYVQYSNEEKGLTIADLELIQIVAENKGTKTDLPYKLLCQSFGFSFSKTVSNKLCKYLSL